MEITDKRPFVCEICKGEKELVSCRDCVQRANAEVIKRLMEERPEDRISWILETILQELRDVKEELRQARIKNTKIKPDTLSIFEEWGK